MKHCNCQICKRKRQERIDGINNINHDFPWNCARSTHKGYAKRDGNKKTKREYQMGVGELLSLKETS